MKFDFEELFCKAFSALIESNGGSIESAMDDMGIIKEADRKKLREWYGWDDEDIDDEEDDNDDNKIIKENACDCIALTEYEGGEPVHYTKSDKELQEWLDADEEHSWFPVDNNPEDEEEDA